MFFQCILHLGGWNNVNAKCSYAFANLRIFQKMFRLIILFLKLGIDFRHKVTIYVTQSYFFKIPIMNYFVNKSQDDYQLVGFFNPEQEFLLLFFHIVFISIDNMNSHTFNFSSFKDDNYYALTRSNFKCTSLL